jgi:protein tyrosine/serine phosphatase
MAHMKKWQVGLGIGLALTVLGCGQSLPMPVLTPGAQSAIFSRVVKAPSMGTENFTKVHDTLYRGGYPDETALKIAVQIGIKTVISLQGGGTSAIFERPLIAAEKANAAKLGITFINIPLPFTTPPQAMVDQMDATLTNKASQPCYIHCAHGRDRTGTMVASYRIKYDGLTNDQAFTEMKTFGFDPKKYPYFADFVQHYKP